MKKAIIGAAFIAALFTVSYCGRVEANIQAPAVTSIVTSGNKSAPELIHLTAAAQSPAPSKKNITADSAKIISPRVRSVLSADTVVYEIEPKLPVDSAMLFVRHSQSIIDTLGVLSSPPYKAIWRCASVPDQDQMHLQFGYVLYCPDSVVITSPALPHRWVSDRGIRPSKKHYHIRQLTKPDSFEVNGGLTKWKHVKGADIGHAAHFKLLWTSAKLYFIIDVKSNSVTDGDFAELHLDFHRDRSQFSGINHRSLRFSPRGRASSFVVELNDSGFVHCDSVNALIASEMERKIVVNSSGYIIEAAIPVTLLSDFDFPPSKIGLDVSVMSGSSFHSWAGAKSFSRYSPRGWGGAKISQASGALKIMFYSTLAITAVTVIAFLIYLAITGYKQRGHDEMEENVYSQLAESVIGDIVKDHQADDDEEDD